MKMISIQNKSAWFLINCFLLLPFTAVFSQEIIPVKEQGAVQVDSLYREDQFYFSFTYNTMQNRPTDFSKGKFSTGYSVGFLRDMPIVKDRTIAIASGLGFTFNSYNQNLSVTGTAQAPIYNIIDAKTSYDKNKFNQLLIDIPLEFRWRTSTYESHKFWRIYGGVKFSYLLYDKSTYSESNGTFVIKGNNDLNKLLYGVYLSSGYNTINVYAYYGLNSLFKKGAEVNGEQLGLKALNVGVIFYIL